MSYSFKYKYLCCTWKCPWGHLGNIPHCMMIALSFCCLPLVLEINIRDLLWQELRALFLVIELLHDNLTDWAIIKTDLITLPKWHLNMMQLSGSYSYNYLLMPEIQSQSFFCHSHYYDEKAPLWKKKKKRLWKHISFKYFFLAFLKHRFWIHHIDIVLKFY